MIHASIYADDVTIIVAPDKEDFEVIAHFLDGFSEVTRSVADVHKSIMAPIRSSNIDLQDVMQSFQISSIQ
jgi:hypothetical protein